MQNGFKNKNGVKLKKKVNKELDVTVDQQLEGAFLFLFGDFVAQKYCVISSIRLCYSADDQRVTLLPDPVVLLQQLSVFYP